MTDFSLRRHLLRALSLTRLPRCFPFLLLSWHSGLFLWALICKYLLLHFSSYFSRHCTCSSERKEQNSSPSCSLLSVGRPLVPPRWPPRFSSPPAPWNVSPAEAGVGYALLITEHSAWSTESTLLRVGAQLMCAERGLCQTPRSALMTQSCRTRGPLPLPTHSQVGLETVTVYTGMRLITPPLQVQQGSPDLRLGLGEAESLHRSLPGRQGNQPLLTTSWWFLFAPSALLPHPLLPQPTSLNFSPGRVIKQKLFPCPSPGLCTLQISVRSLGTTDH